MSLPKETSCLVYGLEKKRILCNQKKDVRNLNELLEAISNILNVPVAQIVGNNTRVRPVMLAKKVFIRLSLKYLEPSKTKLSLYMNHNHANIIHHEKTEWPEIKQAILDFKKKYYITK